ncbi:MAG: hypothetical protein IPG96_13395 [Proteobacteria bacterium]|nr:hypothetical protein [Pseudomonadota bacterium]
MVHEVAHTWSRAASRGEPHARVLGAGRPRAAEL